jgi:tetratricopeptide (TPR) repeat protein
MNGCPSAHQLKQLLDEELAEPEKDNVETHLESCAACQAFLERLANDTPLDGARPSIPPSAGGADLPFLDGLKRVPPWARSQSSGGAEAADTPVPTPASVPTVPGYEVLRELGHGGMGIVYLARQVGLGRLVALKMLPAEAQANTGALARFRTEAEAVARLAHPNIVQIYEVGEAEGRPYLALEYVDGISLARKLGGTPLPTPQAAELVETLARAMQVAHQQRIVHRDLKPANVLLTADGVPKVTDFGLAKLLDGAVAQTQSGGVLGTPPYMAPEQAASKSKAIGTATDVYALGAILYETLTGRPPFQAETPLETLQQVVADEPLPPSRLRLKLPRDLETICLKCLQKEPARRYASAAALADDLQRFLTGEPIRARPVGGAERLWRWCRRNRAVASLLTAVVLLLVSIAAVSSFAAVNREQARRDIAKQKEIAEANERAANEREAEMKAVLQFVEERVFAAARPEGRKGGLGHDVTLRRALEAALPFVAENFPDQPLVEARLRRTLAASFRYLGDAKTATEQDEAARALYTRHRGPDHPDTLGSTVNLALSYHGLGHDADAVKLLESVLPVMKAKMPDHPFTFNCMTNLALSYAGLGRDADALQLQVETLALQKAKLGPDHPDTLRSMNNLAASYAALGRHTDALQLHMETLAVQKARFGPDHPDTLGTMHNLALCYYRLGRPADALKLHEEALALLKAKLGPDHPDTLKSMGSLAGSYSAVGRRADAHKLFEEALTLTKAKLGPDHPDTLGSTVNLALSYHFLGRDADAVKLLESALPVMKAKMPDHPFAFNCMHSLAMSYAGLGRHGDALKLKKETLALQRAKLGPDHPDTLLTMGNLANSYQALRRHAEALQLYEETLARRKAKLGPDHPDTLASMHNLANSYHALGRHAEALKLHEETLAVFKAKLGPGHPKTLTSMNSLAVTYTDLGRHAEALKLFEEALALGKAKLGPDHPDALKSMWGMAECFVKLDRGAEAVPVIDDCVERAAGKVVDPNLLPSVMDLRLRHFEKAKDAAGCRQTAVMWEKLNRADADSLYTAACMRAVTAAVIRGTDLKSVLPKQAELEADRAMAWLKQAVAAGYNNAAHMKNDENLDALRDRQDFKKLIEEQETAKPRGKNGDSKMPAGK